MDLLALSRAEESNFENFLFYDIEVFRHDTIIVFKNIEGDTVKTFHNDFGGLKELIKGKVLVGYNNYHYDDIVISAILEDARQERIFAVNNGIMRGEKSFPLDPSIFSLDCFQQINVAKSSLKKVEANIGMDIEETPVPFDTPDPLSEEDYQKTLYYCSHDVLATVNIFKLRWHSYFVGKLQITSMLPKDLQEKALRWNTTTITANILTNGERSTMWDRPYMASAELTAQERLEIKNNLYSKVPELVADNWENFRKVKKFTHHEFGCTFEFGQGGLHGVPEGGNVVIENNVKLLDVTSLYPNIILHLNALGKFTSTYKTIVDKRVSIKHDDPVLSNALKLIINSTYGLMKNQYSKLRNDMGALSVCIFGQIALYDLCRRLYEGGYHLININTDGVAFNKKGAAVIVKDYTEIKQEWEDEFGLSLELSEFDKWIQKDVNNYVAVDDGKIKVKGGMVNHYHDPLCYTGLPLDFYAGVTWSGTNSLGIVHKVLVDVLTQYPKEEWATCGIQEKVNHYIYVDPQPILFQYILQAGNTYKGVYDKDGNPYQKVNRVFATKKDGVTLFKHKEITNSEGETVISKQYFPNAPLKMYVYNKDLKNFTEFEDIIDETYYVNLIKEKLEMWT